MEYIIGVDTGTSNTKAIAFSFDGKILAASNQSYPSIELQEGWHEQDPAVLLNSFITCIRKVVDQLPGHELLGVSCSCAMHSIMAVDEHNGPLCNFITWADNRSASYAKELLVAGVSERLTIETGTPVHPMSPLCKLMWMQQHETGVFGKAYKFISIKEYFFFYLFGVYVIDHSTASATGLFNIKRKTWHAEALQLAGITALRLSDPVPTNTVFRKLYKHASEALSILDTVPFVVGATDGCLATLGSNAIKQGDCSLTIGTSGAVRMMNSSPQLGTDALFNYILDESIYISGGPINNGGIVLKWYAENFLNRKMESESDLTWFAETANTATPGSEGLIFLPYLFGERAPVWDASARAVFFGIHARHLPVHFMRSIIEGISFALYQVMLVLEKNVSPVTNIYCSGGFTTSSMWMQTVADMFNKPVILSTVRDASATGAAILGMKALHYENRFPITEANQKIFQPERKHHQVYQELFPVYVSLYKSLKEQFSELDNFRNKTITRETIDVLK